jgi:hypothetical protein
MNAYLGFGGIVIIASILTVVCVDHAMQHVEAAIVGGHATLTMQLVENNAKAFCPSYPAADPLYAEIRAAAQCERFGL